MSDDEEKKLADVIQFPFHKLKEKQVAEESKYMDALDQFNPNEMDDSTLIATLQSCPLYIIGDVFDPKWWARRVAWMMRIGLSTDHPVVDDVFPELKQCTVIEYTSPKFDLCWFDEDKMIAAIKILTDKPLGKNDILNAEKALTRKGQDPKKYILSFFEPDPKIDVTDWEIIPLVDFSNTLYDCAEAVGGNLDMARNFDDCGSWLLLLDEFTTRYLEHYNNNDANGTAMMRYFAQQLGLDKILDKVAKQGTGLF